MRSPSYTRHIERTRVSDAKASLLDAYASMERHFASNNTYANVTFGAGTPATDVVSRPVSEDAPACAGGSGPSYEQFYCINTSALAVNTFTLQAVARAGGPQAAETLCGTLSINSLGQKTFSGSGTKDQCW